MNILILRGYQLHIVSTPTICSKTPGIQTTKKKRRENKDLVAVMKPLGTATL
jgi:hypothetical protein